LLLGFTCVAYALLFTGVFGEREGLVLVITSRIKPEIMGHVVQSFFQKNSEHSSNL
jgi:hypothetical protein